ncbi:MAG TPA: glycosyltransferase [Candidatus Binatia bacterium]|jgi:dolichol-phosphate mannosyltransferase|nr:glycosyltransferase [Candidatus Binatia bacterium]
MSNPEPPLLTILLPVRNEEMNLRVMLRIIRTVLEFPHEVLVIHDTADDRSVPVVKEAQPVYPGLRAVHNQLGRGVINAIRAGVAEARAPVVTILCADDTGPVLVVDDMLSLINQGCDFVSVTRYAHGGRRLGGSLVGGILSRTANWLFYRVARSPLTDATTGCKMFRREMFERFALESRPIGWAFAFEMSMKAQHLDLRLGEVPLVSIDRLFGGQSTFRVGPWVVEYLSWFLWGCRQTLRRRAWKRPAVSIRVPVFYQPTPPAAPVAPAPRSPETVVAREAKRL